ncbi:LysR substrate-binding domain-containing protein, partial [Atlantibacter subterraneus]|uniref:LysR substrate-binding domain-containing protein n=1 Tax=Atlantibacter subterraneus TaxID=255519 RepID=UPI002FDE5E32
ECMVLRTSPTLWYCAADFVLPKGEPVPLVVLDEPSPYRDVIISHLNSENIPWRISYMASTLAAVRAAVKAGLGVTARPVEMMSPELRVLGISEGLPMLPETEYLLCRNPQSGNELTQVIFQAMQTHYNPWGYDIATTEGKSVLIEDQLE